MARILALGDCAPVTDLVRDSGHELFEAPGRGRTLALARELGPELVLVGGKTDASLGLVRQLAEDAELPLLPVLLVVAGEDGLVERALASGARDIIDPAGPASELRARVEAALRERQAAERVIAERQRKTLLELAGAVAHKINQPLTSMSIIVETLLASHARGDLSGERLAARLREMQRLVDRMAVIVKQVAGVVDYRTVDYVGGVKIIDLEPGSETKLP